MFTVADVKCYHCGFISGDITVEQGRPLQTGKFSPVAACEVSTMNEMVKRTGRIRCFRCEGPVYLDDVRSVRPRPVITDVRPRRGRPSRAEVLARAS